MPNLIWCDHEVSGNVRRPQLCPRPRSGVDFRILGFESGAVGAGDACSDLSTGRSLSVTGRLVGQVAGDARLLEFSFLAFAFRAAEPKTRLPYALALTRRSSPDPRPCGRGSGTSLRSHRFSLVFRGEDQNAAAVAEGDLSGKPPVPHASPPAQSLDLPKINAPKAQATAEARVPIFHTNKEDLQLPQSSLGRQKSDDLRLPTFNREKSEQLHGIIFLQRSVSLSSCIPSNAQLPPVSQFWASGIPLAPRVACGLPPPLCAANFLVEIFWKFFGTCLKIFWKNSKTR